MTHEEVINSINQKLQELDEEPIQDDDFRRQKVARELLVVNGMLTIIIENNAVK